MENMEFYWDMVSHIVDIAWMGINGGLICYFVRPFVGKNRNIRIVGVVYFIVMLTLYLSYELLHIDGYVADLIDMATVFVAIYLIDRRNINQKLFLVVIICLVEWISHGIALIPREVLWKFLIALPYLRTQHMLQFANFVFVEIVYVAMKFLSMIFLYHMIDKAYVYKREDISKKEMALMLATPLSVFAGHLIFSHYSRAYEADMKQYIWNIHSEFNWIEVLYQLISLVAIMATIIAYQNMKESHRKEKENALLAEQVEATKRHIREIERLYRDIRGLRHDMGNHVATLENLFLKNEPEEAEKYLLRLKEQLNAITPEIKSGNPITDVILMEMQKEAMERGIEFHCDFHYPQGTDIDAFDLSVILNNALTNAIEGAEGSTKPYVDISSYRNKNVYMIEIKNSFQKELEINGESGLPETTKADRKSHGFGLLNIRQVAQKYFGDIDIEQNGQNFKLSILLMADR